MMSPAPPMKPCHPVRLRFGPASFLLAGLLVCLPSGVFGDTPAPAPAASTVAGATNLTAQGEPPPAEDAAPESGRPPSLDAAFDFGPDFGGTREFLMDEQKHQGPSDSEWRQRIEMARQQRKSGDFQIAFANLQSVLDGRAHDDLKKTALLELATTQYAARQFHESLKSYGIFRRRYPQDAGLPQVLLYQGLLLRELGAPQAALGKFHSVLSATLNLNLDKVDYYRRLVVFAQGQIAETLYAQGKLDEAAEKYTVLLRDDSKHLNHARIRYQLIQCLEGQGRHAELVAAARSFLENDVASTEDPHTLALVPHVRYLLATSLKALGRKSEALAEVKALLAAATDHSSPSWKAWKQRTGNEIANQLYQDGDYFNALNLYLRLAELDSSLAWQLPVWYQIGLINERLDAPPEALKSYEQILQREAELTADSGPALATLVNMARWRRDFIQWKFEADKARIQLQRLPELSGQTARNP